MDEVINELFSVYLLLDRFYRLPVAQNKARRNESEKLESFGNGYEVTGTCIG